MDDDIRNLIFRAIDQTISSCDFDRLQDAIEQSEEVRREYLAAVHLLESLSEIAADEAVAAESFANPNTRREREIGETPPLVSRLADTPGWDLRSPKLLALAATILMIVGGAAFWFGQRDIGTGVIPIADTNSQATDKQESLVAGHAALRRLVDLKWSTDAATYREGDVLPAGTLRFEEGVAEIDFFCGATLIVEGPAVLDVESDWSVRVNRGRLRANVPPAARGFVVKAAESEIVDLGTEFALEVGLENTRVEVIEGEVELRGGDHHGDRLLTGEGRSLAGKLAESGTFEGLSTLADLQVRRDDAAAQHFETWKTHSGRLSIDQRLVAYFPISEAQSERIVRNAASTGGGLDGNLVGPVNRVAGRFGPLSSGLEFDRTGARVRTRIDGQFQSFTFACWARIDSLDHVYNALFMADGYENGEPHWQIRDDGRLMFSVMVDDTKEVRVQSRIDRKIVRDAGLHHVYYTEPFWDESKSGQWFHLAAVYDPAGRHVTQYVNGVQLGSEPIVDKFYIADLKIGAAELGNWGQPFRDSPWFSVRNLNGTIDELALFNAALSSQEIRNLYESGKPLGF